MDYDLKPNDYISIVSAVVAAIAAGFAFVSSKHAKRQADAVLGEIPPSFGAYQNPTEEYSSIASLSIEIINHNRRALLIEEVSLEYPNTVLIYRDSSNSRAVIGEIMDAVTQGPRTLSFEIPYRLRGSSPNSDPAMMILPFDCQWRDQEPTAPTKFFFRVRFRLDGDRESQDAVGGLQIVPPKVDF